MKALSSLALLCLFVINCHAIDVNGVVSLAGTTDYSGVTISFIPKSQSAVANEVQSLSDGSYSANVTAGVYDIRFSKSGYDQYLLIDEFISTTVTLQPVLLANAPPENVSGNVSGTWVNTKTYVVTGDLRVPEGTELIIEPGTTIKFSGYYKLQVYGKLTALGTQEKKILFTSSTVTKARGDWAGIEVYTTTDTTRFDHCQIEYAGKEIDSKAIVYNNGKLRVSNSLIRGSGYAGIFNLYGGYLKLYRSEITDIYFYGVITSQSAVGSSITDNYIHHIDRIGASCQWSSSEFARNEISYAGFYGIQSWGVALYEKNLLHHNSVAIFVVGDKPTIRNNTIIANTHGLGFYNSDFWNPSAIVTSNIIANNSGYGIYCEGIFKPETVAYNLFNGNSSGIANRGPVGLGVVITTNARGFASDTYMNIFQAPGFVSTDESSDDFLKLMQQSAPIDSGDPALLDPDKSISDCGAIYFQKYLQDLTFDALPAKTFGDSDFTLSATVSTNLPITFVSSNNSIASIQGNIITINGGGKVNITARQEGDIDYRLTEVTHELTVNPKSQTITFGPLPSKTFGDANFTVTATTTSNLPVSFVSSDENIVSVSGNEITIKRGGTATITARQTGNANYSSAPEVQQQMVINRATQLITFDALSAPLFHDKTLTLDASTSSNLPVRYSSSNENIATIEGDVVTFKSVGTITITAQQDGDASYQPAQEVSQDLTITKGDQWISSYDSIPRKTFGDPAFTLSASASSTLPVTVESSDENIASINGNIVTVKGAGTARIKVSQPGNANYNPAPDSIRYLVVEKAQQTITFPTVPDKTFGDSDFQLTATASSTLPVIFISSNEAIASIQGNTVAVKGCGHVSITARQQGNENYLAATDVTHELQIAKSSQTITFAQPAAKTFGDNNFSLTANTSSSLPLTFVSSDETIASIQGNVVTIKSGGAVMITARQQGNENFFAAPEVSHELLINKRNQTITFSPIVTKTFGNPDFIVAAIASSSLPVIFKAKSDHVTIENNSVKIVKAGRATIEAAQAGNISYNSVALTQSFCINPAQPIVTMEINGKGIPVLTSSNETGNQWYYKGLPVEGATSKTLETTMPGVYTVATTADDCSSEASASFALVYTGAEDTHSDFTISAFPNPAKSQVTLIISGSTKEFYTYKILNLVGNKVQQGIAVASEETSISLTDLPAGIYILVVDSAISSQKIRILKE